MYDFERVKMRSLRWCTGKMVIPELESRDF